VVHRSIKQQQQTLRCMGEQRGGLSGEERWPNLEGLLGYFFIDNYSSSTSYLQHLTVTYSKGVGRERLDGVLYKSIK
jgi:hypothetical protein